ncbi:hypothetical protein Vadar_022531 [Vaccinium darrowii]|uniref:Uncharacterized protein n=1 Tax=Vaccinium darrowii TaxID=229202 RepID=A0ACB7XJG6_9ERIC|nr:hypothetical protein Vadar_022531 [Vaccinium darrowii]
MADFQGTGGGGYYLINNARNTLKFPIPSRRFDKADRRQAKFLMKVPPTTPPVLWDVNNNNKMYRRSTTTAGRTSISNKFDSPAGHRRLLHRNKIRAPPPPPPPSRRQRRRSLIKISPNGNRIDDDKWRCDYILSLKQLDLQDLAAEPEEEEEEEEDLAAEPEEEEEEEEEDVADDQGLQRDTTTTTRNQVSISLSIQQHASFGLSVDGRIVTSFTRNCIICSSPYCFKLDTKFNIWVLPSRRQRRTTQMPEIGGDDPSVIYVKPGDEADLDSHIRDTITLASSFQETCSKTCDQSETIVHYVGEQKAPSIDRRWSKLLELKNSSYS